MPSLNQATTNSRVVPPAAVARQPICDKDQRTFGYELLFRKPGAVTAQFDDPNQATDQVIFDSLLEIGLDCMAGRSNVFINVTKEFILNGRCQSVPKDQVILEILEDVEPDAALLGILQTLTAEGYRFAIDDYAYEERLRPLLPFCSFIKVDVKLAGRHAVAERVAELRQFPAKLVAEKVETMEEFEFYQQAGFDYFQGYFLSKPKSITRPRIPRNAASINLLLAKLEQPETNIDEIETIVSEDLALSYQLLRYINSVAFSFPRQIESIGHAVRLVGVERMKTLANLLRLGGVEEQPQELFGTSLVRARMCELMARRQGCPNPHAYFTAGLFSTLDTFLDCRLDEALALLPLSDEVSNALLRHEGPIGRVLRLVRSYETGASDVVNNLPEGEQVGDAYVQALEYDGKLDSSFGNGRTRRAN